jgi:hypothetical protein
VRILLLAFGAVRTTETGKDPTMSRMVQRSVGAMAALAALGTVLACSVPGLGGDDNKAACDAVKEELQTITTQAANQVTNPSAAVKTYKDGAARIRNEGGKAGGDVADASDEVATELEKLADAVSSISGGTPTVPDSSGLNSAGAKLQAACS